MTPSDAPPPDATKPDATKPDTTEPDATKPDATTKPATTPKPESTAALKPVGPEPAPDTDSAVPEKLTRMQVAGWWTIFGGVALGTIGGVLSGLSEREEDRALRLSVQFDTQTGAQAQYEDVKGEYEAALDKGQRQANAAIAFGVLGLAACIAGVAVLTADGVKRRKASRAKVRAHGPLGLEVRF